MSAQHVVTAACVVAKTASDTGEGYFYRDAILPAGVPAAEKRRLVEAGLVKVVDAVVVEVAADPVTGVPEVVAVTEPPAGGPEVAADPVTGVPEVVAVTEPPAGGPEVTDAAPRRTRPARAAAEV